MPAPSVAARRIDPTESTIPIPRTGMALSARTLTWLTTHPDARQVVSSVWATLTELEQAGQHHGVLDALRFVLTTTNLPAAPAAAPPVAAAAGASCGAADRFPAWSGVRSAVSCSDT